MASQVLVPPSANWYGSSLSALHSLEFAYCAQNAIVVIHLDSPTLSIEILSGYSSRTTCVAFLEKEGTVFVVSASQDRCIHVWKRVPSETRYSRHRVMSKRPSEIRSISCDWHGAVVIGDKHGNVFLWDVAETGSKIQRVGESLKSAITSVACCPSRLYRICGVGCVDGSVYVMGYEGVAPVLCTRMDTEIHCVAWCEMGEGVFLLAASCKSGWISVIQIWLSGDAVEDTVVARFENCDGGSNSVRQDQSANRFWGALEWVSVSTSNGDTKTYLLSSSYGGKIFAWNVEDMLQHSSEEREISPACKLPENHTRAVFSVKSCVSGNSLYITSIGLDRMCSVWTVPLPTMPNQSFEWKGAKFSQKYLGLGAHPACVDSSSSNGTHMSIALGCGDGTIRISSCSVEGTKLRDDTVLWKDIPSPVTVVSWHPDSDAILCFGCSDGSVGMMNLSDKKIHLGTMRHKMPVAALAWVSEGDDAMRHLQSWCTSGVVLSWPNLDTIMDTKKTSVKGPRDMEPAHTITLDASARIMCMSTRFAGRLDTIVSGLSNGCVEIWACQHAEARRVLWSCRLEDPEESRVLMVTSTSDEQVVILSDSGVLQAFQNTENGPICTARGSISDAFPNATPTSMNAYALAQGDNGHTFSLVVVGFDSGMIVVYFYRIDEAKYPAEMKKVDVLKGHSAPVLQCHWACLKKEDVALITTSQDQSVRLWNLNIEPYITALHRVEDAETLSSEPVAEETASKDVKIKPKAKHKDGSTCLSTVLPAVLPISEDTQSCIRERLDAIVEQGSEGLHANMDDIKHAISEYDIDIDVPISAVDSQSYIDICSQKMEEVAKSSKSDQLSHRRTAAHRAAALKLWEGNIAGALRILLAHDALTADFVCFAAGAGRDAWIATARVFADQLEKKGDIHLAALYLTQVGDIVDACLVYERHKMLREAATLASCRLPSHHTVTLRCVESYAKQLARTGNPIKGSLVLAGLGQFDKAHNMLAHTNTD